MNNELRTMNGCPDGCILPSGRYCPCVVAEVDHGEPYRDICKFLGEPSLCLSVLNKMKEITKAKISQSIAEGENPLPRHIGLLDQCEEAIQVYREQVGEL